MQQINKVPKVYIAGQIEIQVNRQQTRFGLVNNVMTHQENQHPEISPQRIITFDKLNYIYTGPYVYACHHMCTKDICRKDKVFDNAINHCQNQSHQVFQRAKHGIRETEYVIAWIENEKCFGTFIELGYAHSLGKKIYIAYSRNISTPHDLWFVFSTAQAHRQFSTRDRAMKWGFNCINADCSLVSSQMQIKQCFGCNSENCHLRKQKIKHCWSCGQKGFYANDCPLCSKKK